MTDSSATSSNGAPGWLGAAWREEFDDTARAIAGAFLFGVPLLFTMEMWWIGEYLARSLVVVLIAVSLAVNTMLAYIGGFRRDDCTVLDAFVEAIEATAIGAVCAAIMLVALDRVSQGDSAQAVLGIIAVQMVPLSLGASVANLVFSRDNTRSGENGEGDDTRSPWQVFANDIGATVAGSLFVGFSIAPTEEIPMLARAMDLPHLLAVVGVSLLAGYLIVFASGFDPDHSKESQHAGGLFQRPISETLLCYVVSLTVALGMLVVFGHIDAANSVTGAIAELVVLGVPAAIGGAAGRVVL